MTYETLFNSVKSCIIEDIADVGLFGSESDLYNGLMRIAQQSSDSMLRTIMAFLNVYHNMDEDTCEAYKAEISEIAATCAANYLNSHYSLKNA